MFGIRAHYWININTWKWYRSNLDWDKYFAKRFWTDNIQQELPGQIITQPDFGNLLLAWRWQLRVSKAHRQAVGQISNCVDKCWITLTDYFIQRVDRLGLTKPFNVGILPLIDGMTELSWVDLQQQNNQNHIWNMKAPTSTKKTLGPFFTLHQLCIKLLNDSNLYVPRLGFIVWTFVIQCGCSNQVLKNM